MGGIDPRLSAEILLQCGCVSLLDLWVMYWGQGGSADLFEFDAFIHGMPLLPETDRDVLKWALEDLRL